MPQYRRTLATALLALAAATPASAAPPIGASGPGVTRSDAVVDIRDADGAVIGTLTATCSYTPKFNQNGSQFAAYFYTGASVTTSAVPYLTVQCQVDDAWTFGPVGSHTTNLEQGFQQSWGSGTPKLCVTATAWYYGTPTPATSCRRGIGVGIGPVDVAVHHDGLEAVSDAPAVTNTCTASTTRCAGAVLGFADRAGAGATGGGQAEVNAADNTVVVPLP
jgi:hypothetical protein